MNKEKENFNKCPICGRPTHKESKYCIFHAGAEEKTEEEFKKALKEYVDTIKKEDGNYDFRNFIFIGDINFEKDLNIAVFKNAKFGSADFKGNAFFIEVIFEGDADFKEATFKGIADFKRATFEGITNFEMVTFKGDAVFMEAIFEVYAGFSEAIFEGDAGFCNAIFKTNSKFVRAIFREWADFTEVTFERIAEFKEATFKGEPDFERVIFKEYADFERATFEELTNFEMAIFEGGTNFKEATFEGGADFIGAKFDLSTHFMEATFEGDADFMEATFGGDTKFMGATFGGDAEFMGVTFKEDVNFEVKSFAKDVIFENIRVLSGKKLILKVENNETLVFFERAYLEGACLYISLIAGVLIDFDDALLRNTKIEKSQIKNHILQEKKEEFSKAKEIYLLLKNNFHSIGRYEDESWAFEKEKEMERKSLSFPYYKIAFKDESKKEKFPILKWIKKGDLKKWIISGFSNIIYGYGEKPWNVIFSAGVLIFIFALLFSLIGIGTPEIIELKGAEIHQNSGNIVDLASKGLIKNNVIKNFPDSLYFSLITFTTLGYGDFRPLEGWGRILAGSEAFIGAFMMALFVYTFARRTGGR